jgi:hypothetical protein
MAASAPAPAPEIESMMARVALECGGDISSSQEEILAASSFLGGDTDLPASQSQDDEEVEVFATPPDATQQHEDPITMCTLPFTPSPSKSPAPRSAEAALAPPSSQPQAPTPLSPNDGDDAPPANPRRKPRVCVRKVRGARIRTPSPSPKQQLQPQPKPNQLIHVDPLVRAVLMIPTRTTTAATVTTSSGKQDPVGDFIALARHKGIFAKSPS